MTQASAVARQIKRKGAPYTIRRETIAAGVNAWTAGAKTYTYYSCRAFERITGASDMGGGILQNGFSIVIDPASVAIVPKDNDEIALGTFTSEAGGPEWRTMTNVDIRRERGVAVLYAAEARL